jgi:hypothetical protein
MNAQSAPILRLDINERLSYEVGMPFDTHPDYIEHTLGPYMARARNQVRQYGMTAVGQEDLFLGSAAIQVLLEQAIPPTALRMHEIFDSPKAAELYDFLANRLSRSDANAIFMEHWHYKRFTHYGRKVFECTPGLAEQLKYTEFRSVTVDSIHSPYPELYIKTPPNSELVFDSLYLGKRDRASTVPVRGLYLAEVAIDTITDTEYGKRMRRWMLERLHKEGLTDEQIQTTRSWRILVVGQDPSLAPNGDLSTFSFDVLLPPGWSPEKCIDLKAEMNANLSEELQPLYVKREVDTLMEDVSWRGLFHWVFNVITYATLPNAEREEIWANKDARNLRDRISKLPKNSKKRDELKDRLRAIDPQRRIVLGRSIKRLEVQERLAGKTQEGRKLIWKLLVTGHWRNQAYGHGYAEHKLIWINPYWKGPRDAPEANPRRVIPEAPTEPL